MKKFLIHHYREIGLTLILIAMSLFAVNRLFYDLSYLFYSETTSAKVVQLEEERGSDTKIVVRYFNTFDQTLYYAQKKIPDRKIAARRE